MWPEKEPQPKIEEIFLTMHPDRVRFSREKQAPGDPVIYWMSRDQRSRDNWALWYAQPMALEQKFPSWLFFVWCRIF